MIDLNIPKTEQNIDTRQLSKFARMPLLDVTNVVLTDILTMFHQLGSAFEACDPCVESLETILPIDHYLHLYGATRTAIDSYGVQLSDMGIVLSVENFNDTMIAIERKKEDAYILLNTTLQHMYDMFNSTSFVESYTLSMSNINKRLISQLKKIRDPKYQLKDNKTMGVSPDTFKMQSRALVAASTMLNTKRFDLEHDDIKYMFKDAMMSLEHIDYKFGSALNLFWSLDDVRKLGDYIENFMIPNTLKFQKLAEQLKQGCKDIINNYSVTKYRNLNSLRFVTEHVVEVGTRLTSQFVEMTK